MQKEERILANLLIEDRPLDAGLSGDVLGQNIKICLSPYITKPLYDGQ
jgi:hypothetical protein